MCDAVGKQCPHPEARNSGLAYLRQLAFRPWWTWRRTRRFFSACFLWRHGRHPGAEPNTEKYKGNKDEAERAESHVAGHLRRLRDSLSETQKEELASLNERGVDSQQGASSKGSRIPTTPKRRPRNIYCSVGQLANDTAL